MAPNVPDEIWRLIAQFIPDEILWSQLRTLNSAFFQVALDAHYREVQLFHAHPMNDSGWAKTLRCWERLRNPIVAGRIRTLSVDATFLDQYFKCYDCRALEVYSRPWKPTFPVLRRFRRESSSSPKHTEQKYQNSTSELFDRYSKALADTLACFSLITKYKVRWTYQADIHSILVMAYIWMSLGPNLCTLDWESPLESFHRVLLESPSIHFPVLRNLFLNVHPSSEQSIGEIEKFRGSVAPFFSRHCATLQSLSFVDATLFLLPTDPTPALPVAEPSPRLKRLKLELSIVSGKYVQISTPMVLSRLLESSANTLQHLSLYFTGIHPDGLHDLQEVDDAVRQVFHGGLYHLVTLEIYYNSRALFQRPTLKAAILEIARSFSMTLTTLVLDASFNEANLTYEQVETLVLAFSGRPANTGLKTLLLPVEVLSPELVDLLAFVLPDLKKLTLKIGLICAHQAGRLYYRVHREYHWHWASRLYRPPSPDAVYTLDAFEFEMKKRVYRNWALRYIEIKQTYPLSHCIRAGTIIAERIPDAQCVVVRGNRSF